MSKTLKGQLMTPDEIQALREKHCSEVCDCEPEENCSLSLPHCAHCEYEIYPCDVIKLLDAYQEIKWELELALKDLEEVETKLGTYPQSYCDHLWVNKAGSGYRATPVEICVKCYAEREEKL